MKYTVIFISLLTLYACKESVSKVDSSASTQAQRVDISIEEAHEIWKTQPLIRFLDVRTPEEIDQGFIDDALLADVKADDFREVINKLDKDTEYVVYCRSGRRSVKASQIMLEEGFTKVKNMKGGYNAWKEVYE